MGGEELSSLHFEKLHSHSFRSQLQYSTTLGMYYTCQISTLFKLLSAFSWLIATPRCCTRNTIFHQKFLHMVGKVAISVDARTRSPA